MIRNVPDPGLSLDVRLADKIRIATGRARWNGHDLEALANDENAYKVRHVLRGHAKLVFPEQKVDLLNFKKDPGEEWDVLEDNTPPGKEFAILTRVDDTLFLDGDQINLYVTVQQAREKHNCGSDVMKSLIGRNVLGGALFNHLLKNQFMIPDDWITNEHNNYQHIYFWGTKNIRKNAPNEELIRYMFYTPEGWREHYNWIGNDHWNRNTPAAEIVIEPSTS